MKALTKSHSVEAAKSCEKTYRVAGPVSTTETRIGDRCVLISDDVSHEGTIKFIGHLKGHSELYAGVDFDEEIGDGTGVYQGEILFHTAKNHAGFVPLSELYIPHLQTQLLTPYPVSVINSVPFLKMSTETSSKTPPPPIPPPPVVRRLNQHSLTPPPVPPPPRLAESRCKMSPPPVPPPPMHVEDYMINPFKSGDRVRVYHLGACRSGVIIWMGDAISIGFDRIEASAIVVLDDTAPQGWRLPNKVFTSHAEAREVLVPIAALRRDRHRHRSSSDSKSQLERDWSLSAQLPSGNQTTHCLDDKLFMKVANIVQTELDRSRESFEKKTATLLSELNDKAKRLTRLEDELIKAQMSEIETRCHLAASDERIKLLEKQLAAEKTNLRNSKLAHLQVDKGKQAASKSNIIEADIPGKQLQTSEKTHDTSNFESHRDESEPEVEEWTHF